MRELPKSSTPLAHPVIRDPRSSALPPVTLRDSDTPTVTLGHGLLAMTIGDLHSLQAKFTSFSTKSLKFQFFFSSFPYCIMTDRALCTIFEKFMACFSIGMIKPRMMLARKFYGNSLKIRKNMGKSIYLEALLL